MTQKRSIWFKLSGGCGILAPIVASACIFAAIASYLPFSWTENALSDLGVQEGVTAPLFNSGLVIGGILTLIFAVGLFTFLSDKLLGRIGTFVFIFAALALMLIGVFPENVKPTHYYVSVAFFILSPLAMLTIGAVLLLIAKKMLGLFTLITAIVAALVWVIHWTVGFGSNVAIPEALSALSMSLWSIVLGVKMLAANSLSSR